MIYYFGLEQEESLSDIIKKKIVSIAIFDDETKKVYYLKNNQTGFYDFIKDVFENSEIKKIGYEMGNNYIILKQNGITMKNIAHDVAVASYILNPTKGKYELENLIEVLKNIYKKMKILQNNLHYFKPIMKIQIIKQYLFMLIAYVNYLIYLKEN